MANNLKCRSWAKKVSEELNKTWLGYIWQDPEETSVGRIYKRTKESVINMRTRCSLIFSCEIRLEWAGEEYSLLHEE